ncbi:MAG: fused MFS/spermidine synthase [Pseudomonadota bacterium]|uniref:spermidine synthase n=1 Tax=Gallaecimonas pentaromativorans TaxID=584787 RepID=UPI00067EC757|nr:fused MFS/spermidine synthase [Gallaecimonas pentaromativorans]MED5525913.1 fused MFS/spermidine synthase [Pseudomonadota bacterium]
MKLLPLLLSAFAASTSAKTVHQERSLYQNISVVEQNGRRCLVFAAVRGDQNQTCQYLDHSQKLVFPYVRMVLAGLLVNPEPQKILMVGLGGGSVPTVLRRLYPDASIDIVEIDPAVEKVAKTYFGFEEDPKMQVKVSDARVFIKRAQLQKAQYDLVILDAFNGDYIPEHLITQEFLQETRTLLGNSGVLVANTFSTSKLYDHESATYRQVFGAFFNFKMENTQNRVVIASTAPLPSEATLQQRAAALAERLAPFGVAIEDYPPALSTATDWDTGARILTDQYSPANLLQRQE